MEQRRIVGIVGVLTLALAWFLAATPAYAQAPAVGLLRVGHLSPTTPAVDVYVSAEGATPATQPEARGAAYGAVTAYETLAPGRYTVAMRLAGAPAAGPPAVTSTIDVAAGSAQSLMFFDTGAGGAVQGEVLPDSRSGPSAGTGLVRVVQGAQGVGPVGIEATGGPRLATDLAYGTATEYRSVAAKRWDVTIVAGTDRLQAGIDVADGSVTTVVVSRDVSGALTAAPVVDAAGREKTATATRPQGGVAAGGGGAATTADPLPILLGLGGALLLVFAVSEMRRRPSR
jgi:hypothetical protein